MTSGDGALRVAFAADDPRHEEVTGIVDWLRKSVGADAEAVPLRDAAEAGADVVWIHGVRPVALEALGLNGTNLLVRGRLLLTGGAAALPAAAGVDDAAPNDVRRGAWPDDPEDDGLPPLRGHASFRGHPLFDGLGQGAITFAPGPRDEHTLVAYVLPSWPSRARVVAVERSRSAIHPDRATIWEYEGLEGRALCIGGFLPLHGADDGLRPNVERLARNALMRAAAAPAPEERAGPGVGEWRKPGSTAREDRGLPFPELPLLEEPLGTIEFRLRRAGPAGDDAPFTVAGRRAFAVGGAGRGVDEVWAHPIRLAIRPRVAGAESESVTVTPIGVERRLRVGDLVVIERVLVPREGPGCVMEWLSRSHTGEVEIEWLCDLRLAAPYPPGALGPLRWRHAARGVVVASPGDDRAVFAFSTAPESLYAEDASEPDLPLVRVRARVRLTPRVPLRLAIVGGAGEAVIKRALAAADRSLAITRARQAHAERLMVDRLSLDAPDVLLVQSLEWAKQRLDGGLVEAPHVGRSLVTGYGATSEAPHDDATAAGPCFGGPEGARAALACLCTGDFGAARDVLTFLGRHQDASGRVPGECSTSGVARHDAPEATPLYLLLAARYLAWTGDLVLVRSEWLRLLRAYEACMITGAREAEGTAGGILIAALPDLADAAEAIGERGAAVELRSAAGAGPRARGVVPPSASPGGGFPGLSQVQEILGAEPDASRGRLVLRPSPPAGWSRFRVSGLAVGETRVEMTYRRRGPAHTFRLAQARGAAPLQLILEPSLPGRRLRSAAVDGVEAELDARVKGDRIVTPVQVVLDHLREVVLELE